MEAIHNFNNGRGATLCNFCYVIIAEGNTDDLLCKRCDIFITQKLEEVKLRLSKKSFSDHCIEEVDSIIKQLKQ